MMTGFGMGFGWFGFVMMAIFWLATLAAAIWLFSNLFPQNKQTMNGDTPETAVTILKKRYARGEISREEFETMCHEIEQS
jgi:putative membrane protein